MPPCRCPSSPPAARGSFDNECFGLGDLVMNSPLLSLNCFVVCIVMVFWLFCVLWWRVLGHMKI